MSVKSVDVFIVGTGLAGYWMAEALRKEHSELEMLVATQDSGDFYHKPQLSQCYALNKTEKQLSMKSAEEMSKALKAEVLTFTEVVKLNTKTHHAELKQGDQVITVAYKICVLAVGSEPVRVFQHKTLSSINTLADLQHVRKSFKEHQKVAILGSGLVGTEMAFDLNMGKHQVSLITMESWPLQRLLPQALGQIIIEKFHSLGIKWFGDQAVESFHDQGFKSKDGLFSADHYLSCIGIKPNTSLATNAGLSVDQGIKVNQWGQTSQANVFALGDCASVLGQNRCYVAPIRHQIKAMTPAVLALLKDQSLESLSPIQYPAMPVMCKNKSLPIRCAHHPKWQGQWDEVVVNGEDGFAIARNEQQVVEAFACVGKEIEHLWTSLLKQMDPYL
ncbi:MAG: FAD-dependent oxidoreductase [Candidatus Comchoanobacterales bacterium]